MSYNKTIWVNDETEVNAENMNHIENGIFDSYNITLLAVTDTEPSECSTGDKYFNTTTNKIYTATGTDTWGTTGEDAKEGVSYVIFDTQENYAYNGTTLIKIGDGTGVVDYEDSTNKPQVNGVTLSGNKTSQDLGLTGLTPQTSYSTSTTESYACSYINNGETYSTSQEIKTNKTWNGKPIYRTCIADTTPSTSTYGSVSTGITNLDTMVNMTGVLDRSDGYAVNMPLNTPEFDCAYRFSSGAFITHPVANVYFSCNYRVIFEYTKTTD